ncbi:MAG: hypothetical protein K0V04_02080 [Deltaproteobacteria bacterium]|nr:hypothetical protein [Deltaproteobacteria bacterium]
MTALDPRTRVLLDALVEEETVTPAHVDHAWRRFSARPPKRKRFGLVLGFGLGAMAMAAAAVVLVPSWRTVLVGDASSSRYSEAPASVGPESSERSQPAVRPRPSSRSPQQDSGASVSPEPAPLEAMVPSTVEPNEGAAAEPTPASTPARRRGSSRGESVKVSPPTQPVAPVEPAATSTLPEELALLDRAERALRRDALDTVGPLLREHARRFEHGLLVEERVALQRALERRRQADATTGTMSTSD